MKFLLLSLVGLIVSSCLFAQSHNPKKDLPGELRYNFSQDGEQYIKATFLAQVWGRYTDNNPGSSVLGYNEPHSYDIGLRRVRFQLYGQITDRVFLYTQIGQNNLSSSAPRKQGIFFHDALGELKIIDQYLSIGGGLTAWGGASRYSTPSTGQLLTLDAPLHLQYTGDISDQFLRKLSLYAKGKIQKIDYRIAISDPMAVSRNTAQVETISENSLFSTEPPKVQFAGYLKYQFLDQESNTTPYSPSSYLGKKSILNIGFGFVNQADAMWHTEGNDTIHSNLSILAADLFFEKPLNQSKQNTFTWYTVFTRADYGKNYLRNVGAMNPATESTNPMIVNGAGNAVPLGGTGNTIYAQAGYLFRKNLLKDLGTIQLFGAMQYSDFDALDEAMIMYELGANWLIASNNAKLSLEYQSRPVFEIDAVGDSKVASRKGMVVMQLQVGI